MQIQLFGGFKITDENEPIPSLTKPRMQSMLAYLLLHVDMPQSRAHLAYTFWPDSSERQARTNLRRELLQLRRALPDADRYLLVESQTLHWNPHADYSLDVDDFLDALDAAETCNQAAQRGEHLEQAVALYQGDLLPGLYDEWLLTEREELAQRYVQALEQLIAVQADARNHTAAIRAAQRLLRYDPLYETGYFRLMELFAGQNDRARALHTYHTCASVLERELGVTPGAEIQQLYKQLQRIVPTTGGKHVPESIESMRLVGRTVEWQTLLKTWRTVNRGAAHFVLIEGEAGIGKTRLGEELLSWLRRQGVSTARSRAYAAEGSLAYAPIIEWLRSDALAARTVQLDAVWQTEIARLLPEMLAADPDLPAPEPLTERWQRQRLFEALARVFTLDPQPLLLLIDDLQWCDQETLEWLRFLLHFNGVTPLLIAGTARSEEINPENSLRVLTNALQGDEQLTVLELAPLSSNESLALAAQVSGQALSEAEADDLYRASEGNPLYVVEMVRAGYQKQHGQAELATAMTTSRDRLPQKVYAVIQSRLAQLSQTARTLMTLAAVAGRSFDFRTLVEASGSDEDAVAAGLDELWRRRIVREQGIDRYDFSHDRIREVAYGDISPTQRRRLHRRVAETLLRMHASDLDAISGELATHFVRANQIPQAIEFHRRAASVARRTFAAEDAISYLSQAINLLRTLENSGKRADMELALQLELSGALQAARGMTAPEVETAYRRAEQLVAQFGATSEQFPARWGRWAYHFSIADHRAALAEGTDLLASATAAGGSDIILQAHHALWTSSFVTGKFREALDHCQQGMAIYRPHEHHAQLYVYGAHDAGVCCMSFEGPTLWALGYPDRAQRSAERAFGLSDGFAHPGSRAQPLHWVALLHQLRLDPEAVRSNALAARKLMRAHEVPFWHGWDECLLGWADARQGNAANGIVQIQAGLETMQARQGRLLLTYFLDLLAEAYGLANQVDNALQTVRTALAEIDRTGERWWTADVHRLHGDLLCRQHLEDEAEQAYRHAIAIARQQQARSLELRATTALCRLWQRQGNTQEAFQHLSELYGWFSEGFNTQDLLTAKALLDQLR